MRLLFVTLLASGCGATQPAPAPHPEPEPSLSATAAVEPDTGASEIPPTNDPVVAPTSETSATAPNTHALVVSFISPGNGTDRSAMARLQAVIDATSPAPAQISASWGKEGEHDECFDPGELSSEAFARFVAQARASVAASKKVHVSTDASCRESR